MCPSDFLVSDACRQVLAGLSRKFAWTPNYVQVTTMCPMHSPTTFKCFHRDSPMPTTTCMGKTAVDHYVQVTFSCSLHESKSRKANSVQIIRKVTFQHWATACLTDENFLNIENFLDIAEFSTKKFRSAYSPTPICCICLKGKSSFSLVDECLLCSLSCWAVSIWMFAAIRVRVAACIASAMLAFIHSKVLCLECFVECRPFRWRVFCEAKEDFGVFGQNRSITTVYLVDSASGHMLIKKIKPCMSKIS